MDNEIKINLEEEFSKLFNSPVKIKVKKQSIELKKKNVFISLINTYEQALEKSDKLQSEFDIDLFNYEEPYFEVIDKLFLLMCGLDLYDIISYYFYERYDIEDNINPIIEISESGVETEIYLKTPEDLYNYLIQINPNFLMDK
jgi:hypothetical protein